MMNGKLLNKIYKFIMEKMEGIFTMSQEEKEFCEDCCECNENVETDDLTEAEVEEDEEFEDLDKQDDTEELRNNVEALKDENMKLKEELSKTKNEIETLKDRLLRTTAEYENYRKRSSKEKEGIYTDACTDVIKQMLPVLDNLERAMSVEGSIDDLKKGIEMTLRQFQGSLEKLNIEEIPTDSEFDPNLHNAVMHVEDESLGKNSIAEVFQKGYKRDDKVIRHSMVKVAN